MKPIDTRYQAKRNYFKETGNKVRVPAYQTKFLQPPQVSVAIKPPSLNQKKLKNPLSGLKFLTLKIYGKRIKT